jgi:hypothetical protein
MPSVLCKEIAWKQVDILATLATRLRFDPEEVFHVSIWCMTVQALGSVKCTHLIFKPGYKLISGLAVGVKIERGDLLVDNPICHRIDIVADNITPQSIGFEQGRSSTHERIGHLKTCEIMRLEVYVA